jgi:hypothetical protein
MAVSRKFEVKMDAATWIAHYAVAGHSYGEAPNAFATLVFAS